jgi:uncharacterized membrane protein
MSTGPRPKRIVVVRNNQGREMSNNQGRPITKEMYLNEIPNNFPRKNILWYGDEVPKTASIKTGFLANLNPLDKWKAIFTVSFVATILTIAELVVIYQLVFVDIQEQLEEALQAQVKEKQSTQSRMISFLDSVFGTMYLRERDTIGSLNSLVFSAAVMFVMLLILFTFYAAVKLASISRGSTETGMFNVYMNALITSMLTLLLIGLFQGFPCIMDPEGQFCYSNSFMMFTKDWIFNENFLGIVWNTGLCAGHDPHEGGDKTAEDLIFQAIRPQLEQMKDEAKQSLIENLNEQGFDSQPDDLINVKNISVGTDI